MDALITLLTKAVKGSFEALPPEKFSVEVEGASLRVLGHRGNDWTELPSFLWMPLWEAKFGDLPPTRESLERFLNALPAEHRPLLPFLSREKARALWEAVFPMMGQGLIPPSLLTQVGRIVEVAEVI